jgi:eukaryotic-like serine/threonine-protein kinase
MVPLTGGSIIAGKYRIDQVLAQGGMGKVWRGRHLPLDIDVAIKIMNVTQFDSAEWRARFRREAKAAARLKISNVVQVYDYGLEGDNPYMVMELLEGEDLANQLRREKRLSIAATLRIVDQVCLALTHAHAAGLVHRDLKPANLFLARQGDTEIVKILDFGIAKVIRREATDGSMAIDGSTETGAMLGSPHYMSPEQVRNSKQVDHRSDLWSLGVIVFRCVTGRLPFPGKEVGDVLVDVCTGPVPIPSQVAGDLDPGMDGFLQRALTRDLEMRFQSAEEFARVFAGVAAGSALFAGAPASGVGAPASQPTISEAGSGASPSVVTGAPWVNPERAAEPPSRVLLILGAAVAIAVGGVLSLLTSAHLRGSAEGAAASATASPSGAPPPRAASGTSAEEPEALALPAAALPSSVSSHAPAPSSRPSADAPASPKRAWPAKASPAPTATAAPPTPSRKPNDPLNEM